MGACRPVATRQQRNRLPTPSEVCRLFDDAAIVELAAEAKVPDSARKRFGVAVRRAAQSYVAEARRPTPAELRGKIAALGKDVRAGLDGRRGRVEKAASRLDALPQEARAFLVPQSEIPSSADLLDPENGREALKRLYGLLAAGATVKKSSRQYIDVQYVGRRALVGRPTDYAEMMLVSGLGFAYSEATGKPPERWRNEINRGPFVAFVSHVLDLLGIENDSDPDVVRRYLKGLH